MFKNTRLKVEQTTTGSPSIGAGGHIDLALGTFDRPGPNSNVDNESAIVPKEMVATQLATERPPIEDDDYIPSSLPELSKAAAELAKLVPQEELQKFYLKLKELTDSFVERQEITTMDKSNMQENKKLKILKMINETIKEMEGDEDIPYADRNRALVGFPDIIKANPEEFKDIPAARRYATALGASKSGSSKLRTLVDKIPEEVLDKLQNLAKEEYIDLLEDAMGDDANPDELTDLMKLPAIELYEMSDSFKFFFKAAFVFPSLESFDKSRNKAFRKAITEVEQQLLDVGVPAGDAVLTIRNQVLGLSSRKPAEIKKAYIEAARTGKIREIDVDKLYKQLMARYADMEAKIRAKLADALQKTGEEFLASSLAAYSRMGLAQKADILQKALSHAG